MDIKSAFLTTNIDFEIYKEQPKGFITKNLDSEKLMEIFKNPNTF